MAACKCGCRKIVEPGHGKRKKEFYNASCRKRFGRQKAKNKVGEEIRNAQNVTERDTQAVTDQTVTQQERNIFLVKSSPVSEALYWTLGDEVLLELEQAMKCLRTMSDEKYNKLNHQQKNALGRL